METRYVPFAILVFLILFRSSCGVGFVLANLVIIEFGSDQVSNDSIPGSAGFPVH